MTDCDRLALVRWWWSLAVVLGCLPNPSINDSQVAPDQNPTPACADICDRIEKLCGYAPEGNDGGCTNDTTTGYCDLNFTQAQLQCMAEAGTCQEVWDPQTGCESPPYFTTPDAGMDDGSTDDGATE